jgi:hypothetical protein
MSELIGPSRHAATRISSQEEMHGWDVIRLFDWLGGTDDSESLAET